MLFKRRLESTRAAVLLLMRRVLTATSTFARIQLELRCFKELPRSGSLFHRLR